MLSEQDEQLIAQYFNHTLNDERDKLSFMEKILFNNGNNEFAKAVKLQRSIEQILQRHPVMEARIIAEKLAGDLPTEDINLAIKEAQNDDIIDNAIGQPEKDSLANYQNPTYTLEELLQMFAPIEELEEAASMRASAIEADSANKNLQAMVVLPENGINCHDTLFFDLAEPIASSLLCRIYNNKREQLHEYPIAAGIVSFEVPLLLTPGRYYWELKPNDRLVFRQLGAAVGMFFVHEELMPKN